MGFVILAIGLPRRRRHSGLGKSVWDARLEDRDGSEL